jgi:hypothetical protein
MQGAMGDQVGVPPLVLGMNGALDARVDQLIGTARTEVGVTRSALFRTALFFAMGLALLILGSVGVPRESAVAIFFSVPSWPPGYPWHGLLLSTILCAAALEFVTMVTALGQVGNRA